MSIHPDYKLYYFNLRGWAEPSRQLFKLAHVAFEDIRIEPIVSAEIPEQWKELKPKTPFGQVPFLEVDGVAIPQSAAICRYLARKFGFAGKTPEEEAWADAIVDQFKDFVGPLRQLIIAQRAGNPEETARVQKEVFVPARDGFFKILDGILEKSKSGWLVGDGLTWADLVIADNLETLEKLGVLDGAPSRLIELRGKVNSIEEIKEHNASRPETIV